MRAIKQGDIDERVDCRAVEAVDAQLRAGQPGLAGEAVTEEDETLDDGLAGAPGSS